VSFWYFDEFSSYVRLSQEFKDLYQRAANTFHLIKSIPWWSQRTFRWVSATQAR